MRKQKMNSSLSKAIVLFFFSIIILLTFFFPLAGIKPEPEQKTMKEIFQSGRIKFKPILEISHDSIPNRIMAKSFSKLIQGKGKLFLSDIGVSDIKMFNQEGKFIKKFGIEGRGPGDLLSPTWMNISNDNLVVYEIGNRRFSYFSMDGKFIKIVKPKPKLKGMIYKMRALDDGRFILETTWPEASKENRDIFEWRVLNLYSFNMKFIKELYRQKERHYKYFKNPGPFRRIILPFKPTLYWDTLPGGRIVVGFSGSYQLKIIDFDKNQQTSISRDYVPQEVTRADKELRLSFKFKKNKAYGKFYKENLEFPNYKPVFKQILTDNKGHILVFVFSERDQGKFNHGIFLFDVFDSNGSFINRVNVKNQDELLLKNFTPVKGNAFWGTIDGPDVKFIKYKAM
jgi:6-bladed beta-propeller